MQLEDWLDDLCVRFIINLPEEESQNVERLCFQVEEAQWFYEDFIRPLDPRLPSLSLKAFSLRIFQHCPLFQAWGAHDYTQAFADFMAYKQRVPVRGAIMLNEAMDKVVLVKGWKKGANWSFPRGKINKGENDLDCAVREVYEETGLDVSAAGLVKDEREMKSIDITMREQHMRLYVFSGVPEDTHFEPRTRKEISKIEWYRLTDLPTIKKHKHQDSNGAEHSGPNANKFYMVAPFLGPLKKWIHQQRKNENRYSSNLAAPPLVAEESETDAVSDQPLLHHQQLQMPSDLPEVTVQKSLNPTSQLKQLFSMDQTQPPQPQARPLSPSHLVQADAAKSSALLSLLRGPSTAELRSSPNAPLDQTPFPPQVPRSPHHSHVRQPPMMTYPPPSFDMQLELPTSPQPSFSAAHMRSQVPTHYRSTQARPLERPLFPDSGDGDSSSAGLAPAMAPYQRTGDPEFARPQQPNPRMPAVPPASALPTLTNHTKALLDMFSTKARPPLPPNLQKPAGTSQSLLDLFKSPSASSTQPLPAGPAATYLNQYKQTNFANIVSPRQSTNAPATEARRSPNTQQDGLLKLFGQKPNVSPTNVNAPETGRVELAATPAQPKQDNVLLSLLRKQKSDKSAKHQHPGSTAKEGKVSANMSGPLDQPNFDIIARSQKVDPSEMGRSPLTTHRTLFDPNQPTPVKIMARPETPKQTAAKSPRASKAKMAAASPRKSGKQLQKEQAKPFQPQILKRPQTSEGPPKVKPAENVTGSPRVPDDGVSSNALSMSREASSEKERAAASRKPSQADSHKQTLLSLFGGSSPANSKTVHTPSRMVSPLSISQIVSPQDEVPISAVERPISTRSRMGSLVSVQSAAPPPRPALEKRQTGAQDKAFLLGMLGKIATQQG